MMSGIAWGTSFILLTIVSIPLNGLLISATWGWFVVPIVGARNISIAEGIGLSFFISVAGSVATAHLPRAHASDASATALFGQAIGVGIVGPIIALSLGWVWHTFVL